MRRGEIQIKKGRVFCSLILRPRNRPAQFFTKCFCYQNLLFCSFSVHFGAFETTRHPFDFGIVLERHIDFFVLPPIVGRVCYYIKILKFVEIVDLYIL